MLSKRGQGTTEYLIILAVIIVIALVVVGVMGWFPGMGVGISESQSKAYWQSASPLAITDWQIDGTNTDLVVKNMSTDKIEVKTITLDGVAVGVTDTEISAGGQATLTGSGVTCTSGSTYGYDVVITYDVEDGLSDSTQVGSKALAGTCP